MESDVFGSAWRGIASCQDCCIRDAALFGHLSDADFAFIHRPIDERRIAAGGALYHAGDAGDAVFTVRRGLIKLTRLRSDGTQRIVRLLGPGASVGLETTLGQPYAHTAIALQNTEVCRIPKSVIETLDESVPDFHRHLMRRWADAVDSADSWLTDLATGSARQRLARLLLQLGEAEGEALLLARGDLAAILGITTEHASRTVSEFKSKGVIAQIKAAHYRIDVVKLKAIAEAD